MDRKEIEKILPHRDSMLLLDKAELRDNVAYGEKIITGKEWFLEGHFPGNPVVPGVILCEILAQSCCVCLKDTMTDGKLPYFTGLNKVKFKNPVKPGDTFMTECEIIKEKKPFYFAQGVGKVNGKVCVSAEFSFAIVDK